MAEESIKLSVTPELTEPARGNSRRNDAGKQTFPNSGRNILPHYHRVSISSCHDGGNPRRNSTGKSSSSNSGENIGPHYLRASTGSCHDFCKYGKQHAFEVKARRPIPKRMTTPPSDKQNNIGTVVSAEWKKMTLAKLKAFTDSKTHSPDPPEIIKREIFVPSRKVDVSKQDSSNNKKTTENEIQTASSAKRILSVQSKPVTMKLSSSGDRSVGLIGKRNSDVKPGEKTVTPKATVKRSLSLKLNPLTVKLLSSSDALVALNGKRNSDIKLGRKKGISKTAVKKVLAPPTASLSPKSSVGRVASLNARKYRSLKLASPPKNQNTIWKNKPKQPNNDSAQEKTLHVIEAETENNILESVDGGGIIQSTPSPSLQSPKSLSHLNSPSVSSHGEDLEESEYTESEEDDFISENDETVNINDVEMSKGYHHRAPRKGRVDISEDELVKLKFRRGKVLDLQCENNSPRRLRFRRGRVLGDKADSKGDDRRRSFKKRGGDNVSNVTSASSANVVLRHQDVQGKKDAQGLFNNVIEETASKLVESRKSKVKALVGAFETVISLQESKPSTQTVT